VTSRRELLAGLFASFAQSSGDREVAAFLESVELAAVDVYTTVNEQSRLTTPEVVDAVKDFSSHHQEHADAMNEIAGASATATANPGLLEMLREELADAGTENEVLRLLFDLENAAAATDLLALGSLERDEARELTAAILPVESQHAVVIGVLLEGSSDQLFPVFERDDEAWDPDRYPVAE
jgi:hypothetical protein